MEVVSGIDREELNAVVAQEMEGLKLFIKGVKGNTNDPDSILKDFYRDRYRKRYLGEDGAPLPAPTQNLALAPATAPAKSFGVSTPTRSKAKVSGSFAKREVDWSVANSAAVEDQVGNNAEAMGWKNAIPDGWDCGYTYRYAKDSVPPMARGVPLPATFGGGGGGGKCTQILHAQSLPDSFTRITGREPPQSTKEWVTWQLAKQGPTVYTAQGGVAGALAGVSAGGKIQAVSTDWHGGSGKRGRSIAVDEAMSQRGGEKTFNNTGMVITNPAGYVPLEADKGVTNLGGGKRGRNPYAEGRIINGCEELWKSPQSKPQMNTWGTQTGGGVKGRSPQKDRNQSSNQAGRLW
jgi:hypothetical protein